MGSFINCISARHSKEIPTCPLYVGKMEVGNKWEVETSFRLKLNGKLK